MIRLSPRLLAPALLGLAAVTSAGSSWARPTASPFSVLPYKPTSECHNLAYCYGIAGPWVLVPAQGEATFQIGCPVRAKELGAYLLGGTDSLVSSTHVRVWYDGQLGAPIGSPSNIGNTVLFHAVSDNGKAASFQPLLGCISLKQASKRSTVSARSGAPQGAPQPTRRTTMVTLEPGWDRTILVRCQGKETLAGNWSAVAFGSAGPPHLPAGATITVKNADVRGVVRAVVHTSDTVPYLIQIQVGAFCET